MADTAVQNLTDLGTIAPGNKIVGEKIPGTTGLITYAVEVSDDTTPQLGGNLDLDGHNLNSVTPTELSYLEGTTSAVQAQLDAKQAIVAGVSDTEIGHLNGVTSAIQTQLDAKQAIVSGVSDTEIGYLNGVTSAIQTQLDAKQATITGSASTIDTETLSANKIVITDGSGKIAASTLTTTDLSYIESLTSDAQAQIDAKQAAVAGVDDTEIGYLNGVTSAIQTQLDAKQATITGAASTIVTDDLTLSRALMSNEFGKVVISPVTSTELGYMSGVGAPIQDQIDGLAVAGVADGDKGDVTVSGAGTVWGVKLGYSTTATAAGTTTLTASSSAQQYFTGTTTQTVVLPVTSTLALGRTFTVVNKSTGVVTVNSSGGNEVRQVARNSLARFTVISTSGTSETSWNYDYATNDSGITGSGSLVRATSPTLVTPVLGVASATSINFGGTSLSTYQGFTTWTPVVTFATLGDLAVTYNSQYGFYSRIGNIVTIVFNINVTLTYTTSASTFRITGLPFASNTSTGTTFTGTAVSGSTLTYPAGATSLLSRVTTNASYIVINPQGSAASFADLTVTQLPSGSAYAFSGSLTYLV